MYSKDPIAITECSGASSQCGIERQCRVGGAWQRVNAAIRRALGGRDAAPTGGTGLLDAARRRSGVGNARAPLTGDPINQRVQLEISCLANPKTSKPCVAQKYRHGFITDIESDSLPPGLDEDVVAAISKKKHEPQFLLEWRLKAFRHWQTMQEPTWAHVHYKPIDYQDISYYSAPRAPANAPKSLDEVDPKLLATYAKLGIPLHERARLAGVAVDAVFDSVSVATTFKDKLGKAGVIFCSFSDAVRDHPQLIERYLGSVVPHGRQFLRGAELGGVLGRFLRLRAAGRALPDGAVDLLPHQCRQDRSIRTHLDHRRRRRIGELLGRLHGADAR